MSRQLQLPPRCPISKTNFPNYDPFKDENSRSKLQKSVSESFVLEEQPAWLDDLLGDWEPGLKLKSHRRAASDSGTVLDELLVELPSLNMEKDDRNGCSSLESGCIYGPNSPRSKEKVSVQESAIVSALSEYASHGPVQCVDFPGQQLDSVQDAATGEVNMEAKPFKRHSAQRSRVRKLQYIAELERTVENFQNIVSELAIRVDSLVKQRVYLSVENDQLKHKLARLQQEKFLMERQYQSMTNELQGLKFKGKVKSHFRSNSAGDSNKLHVGVEPAWHMIDMGKLQIN